MPAPRNRPHILVPGAPASEDFTSRRTGRARPAPVPEDRVRHAQRLTAELTRAADQARAAERGILVTLQAPTGVDLKLDSLESKRAGIELRGVAWTEATEEQPATESATVFIPAGKVSHFLQRFHEYETEDTQYGKPKNKDLVNR